MKQLRGFKFRFYPTKEQKIQLAQTFGCTGFVYNWALALRTDSYYQENKSLSYHDTSNALTKLVRENQSIFTETLAVKNMMANHKLAKAIADCGARGEGLNDQTVKCCGS